MVPPFFCVHLQLTKYGGRQSDDLKGRRWSPSSILTPLEKDLLCIQHKKYWTQSSSTHSWRWTAALEMHKNSLQHKADSETGLLRDHFKESMVFTVKSEKWVTWIWCFPGGSDGKECAAMQETGVRSLAQEDPLPEEFHGQRSLLG